MGFKLNLTGDEIKAAQGGGFAILPAATYGAVIYNNNQKVSKSSGKPMYEIDYKITEGPAGKGRRLRAWYSLQPKGLFKLVELNKAVGGAENGFPYPDKNTKAGEFEFADADSYHGEKVNIVVIQEPYEGVDEDGNDATLYRNVVKNVFQYDEEKITTTEDLENQESDDEGAFTL